MFSRFVPGLFDVFFNVSSWLAKLAASLSFPLVREEPAVPEALLPCSLLEGFALSARAGRSSVDTPQWCNISLSSCVGDMREVLSMLAGLLAS